jgi:hypothetical protein
MKLVVFTRFKIVSAVSKWPFPRKTKKTKEGHVSSQKKIASSIPISERSSVLVKSADFHWLASDIERYVSADLYERSESGQDPVISYGGISELEMTETETGSSFESRELSTLPLGNSSIPIQMLRIDPIL